MFDSTRRGLHPGLAQILAVSRTKLDTHPWESNSRLESDIYYKRGAPFLSCHSVERLSSYSNIYPSFSSLGKKKRENTFLPKLYRFSPLVTSRFVFIIECTARWPWRAESPVVSIESSRKNGSPRNKVALRPWDGNRLKRRETDDGDEEEFN